MTKDLAEVSTEHVVYDNPRAEILGLLSFGMWRRAVC